MRRLLLTAVRGAAVAALACGVAAAAGSRGAGAGAAACAPQRVGAAYAAALRGALREGKDVWGERLIASRRGPTYAGIAGRLKPLFLAAGARGRSLGESGAYYVPFGLPSSYGVQTVALHVADGSAILANRTRGPSLTVSVGAGARERYGSCLSRLATPRLFGGYLPILETTYVDAQGAGYREESFAARILQTRSLVSFVALTADATASEDPLEVRFALSARGLAVSDRGSGALVRGPSTYAYLSAGGLVRGSAVTYTVPPGTRRTVYVGWLVDPAPSRAVTLDEARYLRARQTLVDFWSRTLAAGATIEVPERRVQDAERSLLIQNRTLAWRYSIGDRYGTKLSTPEAIDAAGVMGEYGFPDAERSILDVSFWRGPGPAASWTMGEQLLGTARYYQLFRDPGYVEARSPRLAAYVTRLSDRLVRRRLSLLRRERYSSDVYAKVYGLHSQAVVWQGLREMASVWARTGRPALAARARALATRLGAGLRRATRRSRRRLDDGSLFVPVLLVAGEAPYPALTASRLGSYWNLVMPYALASGIFPPGSRESDGVLRYMLAHGSRFLGLVRSDAYTLYRRSRFPISGTNQVYGLNVARFLADNDRPGQLVLSLYGQLAAGMTAGTYVSGEAATVAPVGGQYYRKMFLPPNSASNSSFLETLRLVLIHEVRSGHGVAHGLQLAFATPRAWLQPGRRISVSDAPTSFGRLSYSLSAGHGAVEGRLEVPSSRLLRTLELRIRLPEGRRVTAVSVGGRPYPRFDPATGTIDLSGRTGTISLEARYGRAG
jgi:hypothetical protein